jgi:hypothetical protein
MRVMTGQRWTFESLAGQPRHVLEEVLRSGAAIKSADVVGFEFKGWNLNPMTSFLGVRKFKKGFYRDRKTNIAWGYNVRVRQGRIDEPWVALPSEDHPRRFYFFGVSDPAPGNRYPNALVVNYRQWPGNRPINPVRYMVDYIAAANPTNRDLALGKSYLESPIVTIVLGFFVLERHNATKFQGLQEDKF